MEKKMYHIPTAEILVVETKDVISISGLELPDDEL